MRDMWNYDLSYQAEMFTLAEARKEYSKLRSIANKRIQRLGQSEFRKSTAYRNWSGGFTTLAGLAGESQIRKALYDVARFLKQRTGSVSGARKAQKEFIKTMQGMGYTFINKKNAAEFGEFMREVKKHKDYKGRDSEQLVELFRTAKEKRIDTQSLAKNYETWFKNEKALESAPRSNRTVSFEAFAERAGV